MTLTNTSENAEIVKDMERSGFIQCPPAKTDQPVYAAYKDRVFRLLYKDKGRLLELYNALNNTCYTDENDLTINTLENAIFMKMKNDVSFLIGWDMCLYEHQSTYCPNMPLRGLLYLVDLYKKQIKDIDLSSRKQIKIPTPRYIIFYNGTERDEEEFTQKLSDAFEDTAGGCLELTVRTLNINYGHNKALMDKCRTLADYSYFIAEIRRNSETMSLQAAVVTAVNTCIEKDILRDFLLEQKAEVISMSIYEYNEEYITRELLEDGYERGMTVKLVENIETLMRNLHFTLEQACAGLGITVSDYETAKAEIASPEGGFYGNRT